jgi:hypothetical protein
VKGPYRLWQACFLRLDISSVPNKRTGGFNRLSHANIFFKAPFSFFTLKRAGFGNGKARKSGNRYVCCNA